MPTSLVLASLVCSLGCVRATTIYVRGEGAMRGPIESSDEKFVYVRVSKDLKPRAVPRQDIIDVDHSGSAARFIGIPIALLGAGIATYGAFIYEPPTDCDGGCFDPTVYIVLLGAVTAAPGLITSALGFIEYGKSTSHFDDVPPTQANASLSFAVVPTQNGLAAGVAAEF